MQITTISKYLNMSKYKKILVSLCLVILMAIAATGSMVYIMLKSDKIVKSTYINNIDVSSLTKEEAQSKLESQYKDAESTKINIINDNNSESFTFNQAGLAPDFGKAVDEAYGFGREGNIFSNGYKHFKSAFKPNYVNLELKTTEDTFNKFINELDNKYSVKPKEATVTKDGQNLLLTAGTSGKSVDKDKLTELFKSNLKNISSFNIELPVKELPAKALNADELYSQVKQDPQNAKVEVVNNNLNYVDAVPGIDIDKTELASIVADINSKKVTSKVLPVKYIAPEVTLDAIKPKIFKDTMATWSTQFYRGDQNNDNRAYNIALAVKKLSGKIIAPGETFSFNQSVGSRTEEDGYKVAHAYSDGKVIDDVGGGICQVSTTLYNAALYSDMEVVSRTNHMFTVGYIDLGQDAAVAYDYVDMKFKNTSNYPIKIVGNVTADNRVVFSLVGTSENPGRTIEIRNETVKTLDFDTKYTDDPKMAKGSSYTKTYGMTGYVVDTYKIVKETGNIVSQKKLYTSTYNPLNAEVVRGTAAQ